MSEDSCQSKNGHEVIIAEAECWYIGVRYTFSQLLYTEIFHK